MTDSSSFIEPPIASSKIVSHSSNGFCQFSSIKAKDSKTCKFTSTKAINSSSLYGSNSASLAVGFASDEVSGKKILSTSIFTFAGNLLSAKRQ